MSLAIILGMAAIANLVMNLFLITSYGAKGAAMATIITQAFVAAAFLIKMNYRQTSQN